MILFYIQFLNLCLHFTNNKFTIPTHIEEILEQPIILNPHTKLNFSSNNPYLYIIHPPPPPPPISFQPRLFSYSVIIPNDWKHKIRNETFKNPSSRFSVLTAVVLGQKTTCKNLPVKKFSSPSHLTK